MQTPTMTQTTQTTDSPENYRYRMGHRMRAIREKLGETQATFARRLKVTTLSVHKYETGITCPTAELLHSLQASGVDASYVAFGFPSLATPQARKNFAVAITWVRRECEISSLKVSEDDLVEAAWLMFCKLSYTTVSREKEIEDEAKLALRKFPVSTDVT